LDALKVKMARERIEVIDFLQVTADVRLRLTDEVNAKVAISSGVVLAMVSMLEGIVEANYYGPVIKLDGGDQSVIQSARHLRLNIPWDVWRSSMEIISETRRYIAVPPCHLVVTIESAVSSAPSEKP